MPKKKVTTVEIPAIRRELKRGNQSMGTPYGREWAGHCLGAYGSQNRQAPR